MPKSVQYFQYFGLAFMTVIAFGFVFTNFQKIITRENKQVLGAQSQYLLPDEDNLIKENKYWEEVVAKTPTYRDGYIELADIAYRMGKMDEAKKNLEEALQIDPNSEFIPALEELLH